MDLNFTQSDGIGIVRYGDSRLDASVAIDFKEAFRGLTSEGDQVIFDMSHVEFLDSSGLGALVSVFKGLGAGGRMALCGLQPPVEKVMMLTRMTSLFEIFSTVEEAMAAQGRKLAG